MLSAMPLAMKGERAKPKRPWRENIEALVMAIAVALLFKSFILEISKIPSGSMQPTLMGSPEASVFDRILVDKLCYHFREPERFDIIVFKHPLERSRVMVKRLVGMPGEELKLEYGDVWTRPDSNAAWQILRRPHAVQRAMWKRLDLLHPDRSSWSVVSGGVEWRLLGREAQARGDGRIRFRAGSDSIRDRYADGYPDSLREQIPEHHRDSGRHPVGDLRVEGRIKAFPGLEELVAILREGERIYEFHLPGPGAEAGAAPFITRLAGGSAPAEPAGRGQAWCIPTDRYAAFAAENLDDRLTLEIDGQAVLSIYIEPTGRQESSVELEVRGEGADLDRLMVLRDIYYYWPDFPQRVWQVQIPPGNYVVLGDNTQDSADSRDWQSKTYEWTENGQLRRERGNFRPPHELDVQRSAKDTAQLNPVGALVNGQEFMCFRDEWGERHWFARNESKPGLEIYQPLVPRELVLGRAVAVFWPLKPTRKLWRIGWLH